MPPAALAAFNFRSFGPFSKLVLRPGDHDSLIKLPKICIPQSTSAKPAQVTTATAATAPKSPFFEGTA
jgi:hypothetical protein